MQRFTLQSSATVLLLLGLSCLALEAGAESSFDRDMLAQTCVSDRVFKNGFEGLGPTVLGVHALFNPDVAVSLDTPMVRVIVDDVTVGNILDAINSNSGNDPLAPFEAAGIDVVLTLRWPVDPGASGPGPDPDRIPQGQDRVDALEQVRWLVDATAGRLNYIQINNEPLGGPGSYVPDQFEAGMAWLAEVAETIRTLRNDNPALANLRLVSPALTGVAGLAGGSGSQELEQGIADIVSLAESHFDLLDIHLHVSGVDSIESQLSWLRFCSTTMPLTSLEWSQAKAAKDWLNEDAGDGSDRTNKQVVLDAYDNPMSAEDWQTFVAGAPFSPSFLSDAFTVFGNEGVELAAYGGAWQFGKPVFDLKALFANRTVAGNNVPNQPFHDQFLALPRP